MPLVWFSGISTLKIRCTNCLSDADHNEEGPLDHPIHPVGLGLFMRSNVFLAASLIAWTNCCYRHGSVTPAS